MTRGVRSFSYFLRDEKRAVRRQATCAALGPGSAAEVGGRLVPCSNMFRAQVTVTIAPFAGGARFSVLTFAPDRSKSVLAMNRPSPSPAASSALARLSLFVVT